MLSTRFTLLVGCAIPMQQAGMSSASPPELAAAVSNAGAFGMVSAARAGGSDPASVAGLIERTRALTSRPFGVNFIVRSDDPASLGPVCFEVAAKSATAVELFLWAEPDPKLFDAIHREGALVICQIGSLEMALAAETAGADIIVAQGVEAGGHVRGTVGLLSLLSEVLDRVNVPVLGAGGVASGRAMAAVLAAGADGVRVGTRFAATAEAQLHPIYQQALVSARAEDTVYTEAFSVGWPNAPHRVLRSSVEAAQRYQKGEIIGERLSLDGTRIPVRAFGVGVADRETTGAVEAMPLWAGESVGGVADVQPAADIVRELSAQAEQLLRGSPVYTANVASPSH
jgi:NAD(P)H-dependent flavin oxidoreductase YrpB (nitropropane dioxygenase family)